MLKKMHITRRAQTRLMPGCFTIFEALDCFPPQFHLSEVVNYLLKNGLILVRLSWNRVRFTDCLYVTEILLKNYVNITIIYNFNQSLLYLLSQVPIRDGKNKEIVLQYQCFCKDFNRTGCHCRKEHFEPRSGTTGAGQGGDVWKPLQIHCF